MIKYVFWIFVLSIPGLVRFARLSRLKLGHRIFAFLVWNGINSACFYLSLDNIDEFGPLVGFGITLGLCALAYLMPVIKKSKGQI